MDRLRQMDVDDKVCEHVDLALLGQVYPKEEIERCVRQSQPWASKARRVRQSTMLALVWFVIGMALWSRLSQSLVWQKLVGKRSSLHPGEPEGNLSDSGLSGRRKALGSACLQALMQARCRLIAQPQQMPSAFFGRYRLMAIDGTLFNTADTCANVAAFGGSRNHYGPGAYPQVRCALLAECGSHAVVGLEMSRYDDAARAWSSPLALSDWPKHARTGGMRASPREGFWSTCVNTEGMCWEPCKQAHGNT